MQNNGQFRSDYPDVIFTNTHSAPAVENAPLGGGNNLFAKLGELLKNDIFKQFLPLFFGGKNANNANIFSLMQNFNPDVANLFKSLNVNKTEHTLKTQNENIIDMSDFIKED